MPTIAQRSFAAGEISPALYARVDQTRYATGLRQCRNAIILRTGGSSIRPGTQYIAECATSANPSRLIPFISSAAQAYVVELGEAGYMRFYKNGVQLANTPLLITNVTQSNPAKMTVTNHGLTTGQEIQVSQIQGMTQMNGRNLLVTVIDANTISLSLLNKQPLDSTNFSAYQSGGLIASVISVYHGYTPALLNSVQFVQSADVMYLSVRGYAVKQLKHFSDTNWTMTPLSYGPSQQSPSSINATTGSGSANSTVVFGITAVSSLGEESLPATASFTLPAAHAGANNAWSLTWAPPADAGGTFAIAPFYNVYVQSNGIFGFVGQAAAVFNGSTATYSFQYFGADGPTPIYSQTPPNASQPPDTYNAIGYFQQRLLLGSGVKNAAGTITSKTGFFNNFANGIAVSDTNSLNFTILGRLVQEVRHYLDLGALIILTNEGEFVVEGNGNGIVTPTGINVRQTSFVGAGTIPPLIIGNTAIYVQARGSAVFDLGYENDSRGFNGNELSLFANHLVDNYQITSWAFQKRPHQIVWAVRNDGVLLSLTYIKGESIVAWARHDTLGTFESVVSIPEGQTDAVYVIVNRQVNGQTKRLIERLSTNLDGDFVNCNFTDASLSLNGQNTTNLTMALSGGVNWTYDETLTCTFNFSQTPFFNATDVGNEVVLTGADGQVIRFVISSVTSASVAQGKANRTVPVSLRGIATATWAKGYKNVGGLYHLEGRQVSVVGDGFVVANPNRPLDFQATVQNGQIVLDKPYTNIHVGLPYLSDLETLDIDSTQGETMVGKEMLISAVHVHVQNTRGLWVGAQPPSNDQVNPTENLTEMKPRNQLIENMNQPASMKTTVIEANFPTMFTRGGRVFLRQIDPVPTSILAVEPAGFMQTGGGN